jgi:hypothetical protein
MRFSATCSATSGAHAAAVVVAVDHRDRVDARWIDPASVRLPVRVLDLAVVRVRRNCGRRPRDRTGICQRALAIRQVEATPRSRFQLFRHAPTTAMERALPALPEEAVRLTVWLGGSGAPRELRTRPVTSVVRSGTSSQPGYGEGKNACKTRCSGSAARGERGRCGGAPLTSRYLPQSFMSPAM